jgi:hypothetical protein
MQIKRLLLCALFSVTSALLGQNTYQLKGKVANTQNAPLDLVAISLLSSADSSILKSVYSDEDGSFVFSGVNAGAYFLKAYLLGYAEYRGEKLVVGARLPPSSFPAFNCRKASNSYKKSPLRPKHLM